MAVTEFGTGDPQAVKRWSDSLYRESIGKTYCKRFMGKGADAILRILTDLESSAGDNIKFDLRKQDRSNGVQGDTRLKGFESALTFYQDQVNIDQLRNAHAFRGMTAQRTVHDLRAEGRASLSTWFAWVYDVMFFTYMAGVSGDSNENISGILGGSGFADNALAAPDADHLIDQTGTPFALTDLDAAIAKAKVSNPRVRPTMVNGQPKYVACLHPYSIRSLKTGSTATAWNQIHQNASQRGSSNPIYTGALGEYNGVVLHESEFIQRVGNVTHNVFLGAGAGTIAFGNAWKKSKRGAGGGSHFSYKEEDDDFGNEEAIAAASIFGMTKNTFDSADFGVVRITNTETAPS